MTVLRITRFTVNPADAEEMQARRATLVSAIRATSPGLVETRLAKYDDQTWIDIWRWDSPASAQTALDGVSAIHRGRGRVRTHQGHHRRVRRARQ